MNKLKHFFFTIFFFLISTYFTGCAGTPNIQKIEDNTKAIPTDLLTKFEVLDKDQPVPVEAAKVVAVEKSKKKKLSKKEAPKPVVYPDRAPNPNPIWVGEKQTLEVTYLGLPAGDFTTEVLPMKKILDREVYHFKGTVKSSAAVSLIYRMDDWIESFWDAKGLFSHRFHMVLDETKQKRDVLELFDQEKRKAFFWNRKNQPNQPPEESKEYFDMAPFPQDSFTAIFFARTLPLEIGKTYVFPVVSEGRGWDCEVHVVRKEILDTALGKMSTIVIRPRTFYNGVLKQEHGDSFIWLSDDGRRFVVRLEAKVKVGYVAARLRKLELGDKP